MQGITPASTVTIIDPTTITMVGGMILTIIGTIVTGIVTVITAIRMTHVTTAQAITTANLLTVAKDTEAIKGHVNSEKSIAEGREITLRKENELLRTMIADQKSTASLLAQASAGSVSAAQLLQAAALPGIPISTSSVTEAPAADSSIPVVTAPVTVVSK